MALNFPSSPSIGDTYTDTTSGFSYEWDGTVWKSYTPASSSNIRVLDDISGSFNGSTQTFALAVSGVSLTPASAQQLRIVLGGVVQSPGTDYTVTSSNITFTTAPTAGLTFSGISLGPAVPVTYANDGVIYIRNTYVGSGTTGPFSFPEGYVVGYLDVYRNGVRLSSGTDFVGTSGTNFFLTDAAVVSDEIEAIGYTVTALVQASSNLDNLNVTGITTTNRLQVTTNANIVGIITAASFVGDGSGLTGVANTDFIVSTAITSQTLNITSSAIIQDLTVNGTQTIINTTTLEVADINVGIASTATKLNDAALDGAGITIYGSDGDKTLTWDNANSRMAFSTNLYAPKFFGDGSGLDNVVSGVELKQAGSSVGTAVTQINFASGATLTTASGGISTITIAAGITTTASSPSANTVVTLDLNSAQHHELTLTAGITTITCSGGSFGDSHSVVVIQPVSGIATVGFSTFFLFPSGSSPTLSSGSGKFDLISFVVKRVGATGISTQLLASAGLDYQ